MHAKMYAASMHSKVNYNNNIIASTNLSGNDDTLETLQLTAEISTHASAETPSKLYLDTDLWNEYLLQ